MSLREQFYAGSEVGVLLLLFVGSWWKLAFVGLVVIVLINNFFSVVVGGGWLLDSAGVLWIARTCASDHCCQISQMLLCCSGIGCE